MPKGRKGAKPKTGRNVVEWDGDKYDLAIVMDGRNDLDDQERIKIAELVCSMYATDKYNLTDCLNFVGIKSRGTWYNWVDDIEQIEQIYLESKRLKARVYISRIRETVRNGLEKVINGYTVKTEEVLYEIIENELGEAVKVLKAVREKEVFIKPSERMIEMVLFNQDGRNFEKNPKPIEKINKEVDIPIIRWVEAPETIDINSIDYEETDQKGEES